MRRLLQNGFALSLFVGFLSGCGKNGNAVSPPSTTSPAQPLALAPPQLTYPDDDSLRKGGPVRVPPEFRNGTASVEQAKAWAKSLLLGNGLLVVKQRELTPAGRCALFVSDTSNAGSGGNFYLVFEHTPTGVRYLGDIEFGAYRAVDPDASGRARVATYWRMGASEGQLSLWVLSEDGFKAVRSITILPGDGGAADSNRIYGAFFGNEPVTEALIERTFGVDR